MREPGSTKPVTFFFLVLPYGISSGFVSITLPFVLVRAGFSVALAASIAAVGVAANLWRFLWGPVADLTLTARRWYLLGLATAAVTLLLLGFIPIQHNAIGLLMAVVFISQVAGTLIVLPVGGLMAHTVADEAKGRAAGWYQAGNLGGTGLGGGAGVWLASHFSKEIAGGALAIAMLASAAAIYFASDVRIVSTETIGERMRLLGRDIFDMLRHAIPLFTIVLVMSPIGAGAMNGLWSAVAPDWKAEPDRVALVAGILNGVISAVGCIAGGWIADRVGRWWSYFGSGVALALVAIAMAIIARTPQTFAIGVIVYAFFVGMAYAAFSAVVLFAIGRGAASTKYATLSSLGNIPVVYMTAMNGWVHDRFGTVWMLAAEALAGLVCVALALFVLQLINTMQSRRQVSATVQP
ncbi:MAG: transporter, family, beta-lactamase induction signal transducer AmpG [Verrucomicrobiota bacterium]